MTFIEFLIEQVADAVSHVSVPYVIVGGHALNHYGYGRMTSDIDILVNPHDLNTVVKELDPQEARPIFFGGMATRLHSGNELDILSPNKKWVPEAIRSGIDTPNGKVISLPYLVLMKLWAGRGEKEDNDIIQMLKKMTPDQIKSTKFLVKKYLPNDLEDFDSYVMMKDYAK